MAASYVDAMSASYVVEVFDIPTGRWVVYTRMYDAHDAFHTMLTLKANGSQARWRQEWQYVTEPTEVR
jgi:hypothetical protein